MSVNSGHLSEQDNTYRHGIICRNCVVRCRSKDRGSAVRTVHPGTFVEIHSIVQEAVHFCVVYDDMQLDESQLVCKKSDLLFVPENLWLPLFTVEPRSRISLVEDTRLAEALGNITVGSEVQLLGHDSNKICNASVKFRNSITKLGPGVYFGLKIKEQNQNLESIKSISSLEPGTKGFPRDCDIVVSIDKIRPVNINSSKEKSILQLDKETDVSLKMTHNEATSNATYKTMLTLQVNKERPPNSAKQSSFGNKTMSDQIINYSVVKRAPSNVPLSVGEKVIYFDENQELQKGVVKWLGMIKNSIKVGVEFENPIGSGNGMLNGEELFKAKHNHALLLPLEALIKLSDYLNSDKEQSNRHKINNNNNNNNNNYNNNNNINYYNSIRSNELCCDKKISSEDKYKVPKVNSHQCPKHQDRTFPQSDTFQSKNMDEEVFKNKIKSSDIYKADHTSAESFTHYSSKSFDLPNTCEKKIMNRRQCNSMDSETLSSKESKLWTNAHNFNSPVQKTPSQDLYELMGHVWSTHDSGDVILNGIGVEVDVDFNTASNNVKESSEKDIWDSQYSDHSSGEESTDVHYDTPKPYPESCHASGEFGKGSVVELTYKNEPHYGVIKWTGVIPEERQYSLWAGIEMEEEQSGFTDGTHKHRRYFQCNPHKALFVPLSFCRKDSRFSEENQRQNISSKLNSFGQIDCPVVEGTIPPINRKGDLEDICGKNRGIQGHHNSCYLDATLFAMFAFTSVFDSLLYRPQTKYDILQYSEVQRVLRDEIVNPLRKNLYVRADRVMQLRTLLEELSSVSGLTSEEKDPEEFLNSLLAQILKAEPFLKLSSGQEAFHYQLFVEKDERLTFPSVQQLFEQSFVTSDIKLKQVPSCLIIQMPRFGKSFKMYSRILPPQLLDVTDIIENSPRQCAVCGNLAEYECKDCFGQNGIGNGLESISFCRKCLETAHNHRCRARHNFRSLTVPDEFSELQEHCIIPRLYMELFAVVCIETSHYVSFVKCGSGSEAPWCFFDSMADRKGEQNGYNIPEMVPCPELPFWLSEDGAKTLDGLGDERQLPEYAKRLLCDAYMCMYQSPDMMMYR